MGIFAGILDGQYVVWHKRLAQLFVHLEPALATVSRLELIVGCNVENPVADVKVWSRASSSSSFVFLGSLTPVSIPAFNGDGTFEDVVYRLDMPLTPIADLRFNVTADGVNAREMTPLKKYMIYNNSATPIVGGSHFNINGLGWQTSEVFETIFKYLDLPVSATNPVDIETETIGLLPESRIRNDNLLARVADDEWIVGNWDFETGSLRIERDTSMPANAETGRLFQRLPDGALFIGDGSHWIHLLKDSDITSLPAFSWVFSRQAMVPPGNFLKMGDTVTSTNEGVVIGANVNLSSLSVRVDVVALDSQVVEVLKNGVLVGNVQVVNGTQMGYQDVNVLFDIGDVISVRTSFNNVSYMDSPRVTLLFRSVLV